MKLNLSPFLIPNRRRWALASVVVSIQRMILRIWRVLAIVLVVLVVAAAAFQLGLLSVFVVPIKLPMSAALLEDIRQEEQWFESILQSLILEIQVRNGYIPSDPYLALVESGRVKSFFEFMAFDRAIRIEPLQLPARINVNVEENAKLILFWIFGEDGGRLVA